MTTGPRQHTHRSTWYKGQTLAWRAPFTETPAAYFDGHRDGLASARGPRVFQPPKQPALRRAYGRGWATAMANHAAPGRGRELPPEPARDPRFEYGADGKIKRHPNGTPVLALDDWTRRNDDFIRSTLTRNGSPTARLEMRFDAADLTPAQKPETDTMTKRTTKTAPTPPREIGARMIPANAERGAIVGPIARTAEEKSAAARKAWETRRAQGWTHPGAGNRAPAAPVEPIKRASLAELARQAEAPKPAAEAAVVDRGLRKDGAPALPRRPIRPGAAKPAKKAPKAAPSKPAKAPAKAPAKKAPAKRTKKATKAGRGR